MGYPSAMNAPATTPYGPYVSYARPNPPKQGDSLRDWAYLVIAITAFATGILVGNLSAPARGDSRIAWPSAVSSQPHPRSLRM